MQDYINKVHKIITDHKTDTTTFIIQTDGDQDFWWWQVDNTDIREYFKAHNTGTNLVIALNGHITPTAADIFANDIDNTDKGTSGAAYETIDEILKEFNIL
jgi:hypothetical protein